MTINTQKLREALDLIEYELEASYNNTKPVCCGHGYGECCGNPEPGWDSGDQKIMDVLGPIQRMLSDAVSQFDAQTAEIAEARSQIDRWKKAAESAEDRAQTAADEIARLNAAQAWQPIETAPKDFVTEFDGWNGERVPNVIWARPEYGPKSEYAFCHAVYEHNQGWAMERIQGLTHWMPLPAAPAALSGESNG